MRKRKARQRHRQRRQRDRRRGAAVEKRREVAPEDNGESSDPRGLSVDVTAIGGVPVSEPTQVVVIEPIRLSSGKDLYFQSPFVVPFYLLKSKMLRDAAEPKRAAAVEKTTETPDGTLRPRNPAGAFDALEDLASAVILATAAIETHANDMIGRLPDEAMVEIPTRIGGERAVVMRDKAAMDRLRLEEKLAYAAPLLNGRPSIKGTSAWQKLRQLIRIRNGLLHVKRIPVNDPLKPSAFGRLMLGEGSRAPEDAAAVIEALEPDWLPSNIRSQLGF